MKKSFVFSAIGIIAAILIGWFLFHTPEIANVPPRGKTIVAFGDSLVYGVGATKGHDFASLVSQMVGEPIINLGVSGNTTRDGLSRLDALVAQEPRIVMLLLGGNDYLQRIPKEETFSNLGTIIGRIQESGAAVILIGVRGGILRDSYEEDFKKLSRKYKTGYVPNILEGLLGNTEYMSDTIHPNDVGYEKVAQRVAPVLKRILDAQR